MAVGAGIDDDSGRTAAGLLDPGDQFAFMIGLSEIDLQAKLGSETFEVVTVNIDTRNLDKPKTWLAEAGIKSLGFYSDPSAKVFQELKAIGKATGMPTTLLLDPQGCELGTLAGPAEWASDDAVKLIEAAMNKS